MGTASRSTVILTVVAAMVAACAAPAATPATQAPTVSQPPTTVSPNDVSVTRTFVLASSGGASLDSQVATFLEPWGQMHNIDVTSNPNQDLAQVQAMVEANDVQWDVVTMDGPTAIEYCNELATPIASDRLDTQYLLDSAADALTECSVPYQHTTVVLAWKRDSFGADDHPTSWADFFDPSIPGKRSVAASLPQFNGVYEIAMAAAGGPIYPIDYDVVFAQYEKIKDDIVFYESTAQLQQYLEAGTVDIANSFTSRLTGANRAVGDAFAYDFTWDNTFAFFDNYAIPLGSPNTDAAISFLNFVITPEAQGPHTGVIGLGVVTKDTPVEPADDVVAKYLPTDEDLATAMHRDDAWWAENVTEAVERWTEFALTQ